MEQHTGSGLPADGGGEDAATLDLSGRCVGSSYILIRPLGQGATGTVWRGVDRASGQPVAVKLLHESLMSRPKQVTRFVQERTILLMLRHRNVVRVRDLFSVGESLGLVMDLVPGGSLRDHLREHPTLAPAAAARAGAQIAAALAEAHELGIVHRDLKPDNVLLADARPGKLDVRLTDFGIARVLATPRLTTTNAVVGTPHYMAPEAFHGAPANPAIDVYALGVLLYELVSGCHPYDDDTVHGLMNLHMRGEPLRRPGIPDALWAVISSCLEQKPRLRPTAAELAVELGDVARAVPDAPALPAASSEAAPERRSEPPGPPPLDSPPHPSLAGMPVARPVPRRNQPASWRWARPWGLVGLVSAAMLASGVATTAWHLGRGETSLAAPPPPATVVPSAAAATSATPSPAATTKTRAASRARTRPRAAVTAAVTQALTRPSVRPKPRRTTAKPAPVTEKTTGPWDCARQLAFSMDNALMVEPCHRIGERVQVRAALSAPRTGTATMWVALRDVGNGRTTSDSRTCGDLVYEQGSASHQCGPVTLAPARGHRYQVVMSWRFTREGRTTSGSAKGSAFDF
ncbi:serine/threonine-protein kinase [Symbioplanes lichenis]|uniref:serine/threonine-protein kinase n=1 Tax=Symbioplanes lichenis TaxID=1629072 RepID=UPI002738DEC0|nr:serine/threonine-protein kinase [Actinoplanes lichenis]